MKIVSLYAHYHPKQLSSLSNSPEKTVFPIKLLVGGAKTMPVIFIITMTDFLTQWESAVITEV